MPRNVRRLNFIGFLIARKRWFALSATVVILLMVAAAVFAPLFFDWDAVTPVSYTHLTLPTID